MALNNSKNLKELVCCYKIGDTFTNGDGHFIVVDVKQRDESKKLLKEPLYTMERFPDAIYRDGKKVLTLKPFEAFESEIKRQCTFNWEKLED